MPSANIEVGSNVSNNDLGGAGGPPPPPPPPPPQAISMEEMARRAKEKREKEMQIPKQILPILAVCFLNLNNL